MKRGRRFFSFGLALLSLTICATLVIFWGRSYRCDEGVGYHLGGATHLMVSSQPGYVWFQEARDMGAPSPQLRGIWAYCGYTLDEYEYVQDKPWLGFGAANGQQAIFGAGLSNAGIRPFQDFVYLRTGIALPYWFLAVLAAILPARIARRFFQPFFSGRALVSLALCVMVAVIWAISYYHAQPIWHYLRGKTGQVLVASNSGRVWLMGLYNKPMPGAPRVNWKPGNGKYYFAIDDRDQPLNLDVRTDDQGNLSENNSSYGLLGVWAAEDAWLVRHWGFLVVHGYWGLPDSSVVVALPYWFLTLATLIWPAASAVRTARTRRRDNAKLCSGCGYDLRATPYRCPECGLATGAEY